MPRTSDIDLRPQFDGQGIVAIPNPSVGRLPIQRQHLVLLPSAMCPLLGHLGLRTRGVYGHMKNEVEDGKEEEPVDDELVVID